MVTICHTALDTWANVTVECKVPPVITCPADATIHCDWAIEKFVSSSATKSIAGVDFRRQAYLKHMEYVPIQKYSSETEK
ncbi:MAG: hypothetical protein IPP49_14005 [Saprospiraceae bacterium]|nr:hypothetical protein [Saprospiraceae bacterium]